MTRPDALSLVSRLVELTTQLFTERVELARGELQNGARQAGQRAAWGLGGGLLIAVSIALFAAASVEAMAPLIHNRALRLCIVAVPLAVAGLLLLRRAR